MRDLDGYDPNNWRDRGYILGERLHRMMQVCEAQRASWLAELDKADGLAFYRLDVKDGDRYEVALGFAGPPPDVDDYACWASVARNAAGVFNGVLVRFIPETAELILRRIGTGTAAVFSMGEVAHEDDSRFLDEESECNENDLQFFYEWIGDVEELFRDQIIKFRLGWADNPGMT